MPFLRCQRPVESQKRHSRLSKTSCRRRHVSICGGNTGRRLRLSKIRIRKITSGYHPPATSVAGGSFYPGKKACAAERLIVIANLSGAGHGSRKSSIPVKKDTILGLLPYSFPVSRLLTT